MTRTIPIYIIILIQISLANTWNSRLYSRSTGSTFRTYSTSPGGQFFITAKPYLMVMPKVEFVPAFGTTDNITAEPDEVDSKRLLHEIDEETDEKEESYVEELVIDVQKELAKKKEDYIPIDTNSSEDTEPAV